MLTEKEVEVLKLRRQNKTQSQVAKELRISQAAVSIFEKNALKKIKESVELLDFAKKHKLEVENG